METGTRSEMKSKWWNPEIVLSGIASWLNDSSVFCCYFIIFNRKFLSFLNGLTMRETILRKGLSMRTIRKNGKIKRNERYSL